MACKTHLEGRGREWPQKGIGLRATFQNGQSQHLFFVVPPPANWLKPTVPNNDSQKSFTLYFQRRWKRQQHRITVQLTTSFRFFVMYSFLRLQSASSLVWNKSCFCGVSSATRTKLGSSFIRECHTLHSGEELWRFVLPRSPPDVLSFADQREKEISSFEKVLVSAGNDTSEDITEGKDWNRFFS